MTDDDTAYYSADEADRVAELALMAICDDALSRPVAASTLLMAACILNNAFFRVCTEGGVPETALLRLHAEGLAMSDAFFDRMGLSDTVEGLRLDAERKASIQRLTDLEARKAIAAAVVDVKAGWKPG